MGEIQDQLYMQVVAVVVLFALAKTDNQEHQVQAEQVLQLLFQAVQFKELEVEADLPIPVQLVQFQEEQQEQVAVEKVCQEQDLILMDQLTLAVEAAEALPEDQVHQVLVDQELLF